MKVHGETALIDSTVIFVEKSDRMTAVYLTTGQYSQSEVRFFMCGFVFKYGLHAAVIKRKPLVEPGKILFMEYYNKSAVAKLTKIR